MNDCEFVERVSKIYETKPPRIIPVKIGPARRNNDALSQVMFADKKGALDCEIIRLESCLATKEIPAVLIRGTTALGHGPREIKRLAAALPIAGPMSQFDEKRIGRLDRI